MKTKLIEIANRILLESKVSDVTIKVADEDGFTDSQVAQIKSLFKKNPDTLIHAVDASEYIADNSGQWGMLKKCEGDVYTAKQLVTWLKSIN